MPMNKPMKKMPKKPMPKKGKIAAIAITCLALTGCAGLKSAKDLALNSFKTPKTAVECLQRDIDKENVGKLHDIAAATYDAATGIALMAGTAIATPILLPAEILAGQKASTLGAIATLISDQKDSACKEIREAQ